MAANPARVMTRLKVANGMAEIILPMATHPRGTGLISRGSREPRSRSPAVASVMTGDAPLKMAKMMK